MRDLPERDQAPRRREEEVGPEDWLKAIKATWELFMEQQAPDYVVDHLKSMDEWQLLCRLISGSTPR